MKISLNMQQGDAGASSRAAQDRILEHEIMACKQGDFGAEKRMVQSFMPLFTSLAHKRSKDPAIINQCLDAGKRGLKTAIKKYKPTVGPEKFRIFAVEFIEKSIDESFEVKKGFFARLFG